MAIRAAGPGQEPVDVAITMRTPGEDAELAIGFLYTEGLIAPGDVESVEVGDPAAIAHPDDEVLVRLRVPFDASAIAARNFVATASCGICGKASLDSVALRCPRVAPGPTVTRSALIGLPDALRAGQAVFDRTGGLHAAGLFEPDGRLVRVAEDVGRHNALDKLVGASLLAGDLPLAGRVVLVSGRLAFEIVAKAGAAGAPVPRRRRRAHRPRRRRCGTAGDDPRRVPPRRRLQRVRGPGADRPRAVGDRRTKVAGPAAHRSVAARLGRGAAGVGAWSVPSPRRVSCLARLMPVGIAQGDETQTVRLTFDGRTVSARQGQTVLEVAREHGWYVPSLCYHPKVGQAGLCRVCVAEVDGMAGLQTTCTLPVRDGMVVRTDTALVVAARRMNVDLLLSAGVHDCLACEATGRCELQDAAYRLGIDRPSFPRQGALLPLDVSSEFIVRDPNKCIHCFRCIRGCKDLVINDVLDMGYRGDRSTVICDDDLPMGRS